MILVRTAAYLLCLAVAIVGARGLVVAFSAPASDTEAWRWRAYAEILFLNTDLADKADAMQELFPEGRVFTATLTGLAQADLGKSDSVLALVGLYGARDALEIATDSVSRAPFGRAGGLPHGMFYEAWTTRLRVSIAGLSHLDSYVDDDHPERDSLRASCDRLDAALGQASGFLDSYPGQAWPADNVVGAAALAGCGRQLDVEHYADTARQWLARARQLEDPETGLLPHAAWRPDARGSSAALMTPFLAEIDLDYARLHHERLLDAFGTYMGGVLPALREYPHGRAGEGDIDSGPLVLGASAPASVVAIAAARSVGDRETAEALRASAEWIGMPIQDGGRRYLFGRLPVGDAFLAWASTVPLAEAPPPVASPFASWRLRAYAAIFASVLFGLSLLYAVRRRKARPDLLSGPRER